MGSPFQCDTGFVNNNKKLLDCLVQKERKLGQLKQVRPRAHTFIHPLTFTVNVSIILPFILYFDLGKSYKLVKGCIQMCVLKVDQSCLFSSFFAVLFTFFKKNRIR